MAEHASLLYQTENDFRMFSVFFIISFLCHATVFFVINYSPHHFSSKRRLPSVINVDLASLPLPASADLTSDETANIEKSETVTIPEKKDPEPEIKKETVNIEKKNAVVKKKESLKKKTFKSKEVLESARKRIEENVEQANKNQLNERLKAMQGAVKNDSRNKSGFGIPGATGGPQGGALKDTYLNMIAFQIQKNWNFSSQLAGDSRNLVAAVVFKVLPDGKINDFWFEKRSGNLHLDESAKKAVLKSSPVQAHPPGISAPYVIVAIKFTPAGVQ